MRTRALAAALILVGCSDPIAPGATDPPVVFGTYSAVTIAPDDGSLVPLRFTPAGVLVGRTTVSGVSRVFTWSAANGLILRAASSAEFIASAAADNGDVAGTFNGRPAIWPTGQPDPTPLFRADTTLDAKTAVVALSNRGEVVVNWATGTGFPRAGVWRSGQFVSLGDNTTGRAINNVGSVLAVVLVSQLYNLWTTVKSPFGADSIVSGKNATATCTWGAHGHTQTPVAVNDSNEVLSNGKWLTGAGCVDIDGFTPQVDWTAFNSRGLLGGSSAFGGFDNGVVYRDGQRALVDQVLDSASVASWHVTGVRFIADDGAIVATAFRLSDQAKYFLLLKPKP